MSVVLGRIEHMFETVLEADTLAGWQRSLASALDTSFDTAVGDSGLDDAGRVEAIRALEELVCTATAAQALLAAEFDTSQRAVQAAAGVPAARQGRGVAAQVGLARRESHHRGQRHLALAKVRHPGAAPHLGRVADGRITEWTATLIARETACLTRHDRAAVDEIVAGDPARVEQLGIRQVVATCQAEAARLDVESVVTRRRRAEADRHVSLRPAPDTMTWLTALLPVKDGVAVLAALTQAADTARAPPVTGGVRARSWPTPSSPRSSPGTGRRSPRAGSGSSLDLVMSDPPCSATVTTRPTSTGYGPVPAELARELDHRRLHPAGEDLATSALHQPRHRGAGRDGRPDPMLPARPGPVHPAPRPGLPHPVVRRPDPPHRPRPRPPPRRTDHRRQRPRPVPGLQPRHPSTRLARQTQPRPQRRRPGHQIETTTPTRHTYRTRPPAIATIRVVPIRIDYVLTC